jgi:hypothetical protein
MKPRPAARTISTATKAAPAGAARIRAIDAFRGLSIMLMVFFTLMARLSFPPDPLQHNVPDAIHVGDFVLPMFLFASGMSLVFFRKRRQGVDRKNYALDIVERFGALVLISFLLSPFSAGGFFGMDEVMLNALLFLPCVLMLALPDMAIAAAMLGVAALYVALGASHALPDFNAAYLGGYPAALFYLPVMLGGVLAGRRIAEGKEYVTLVAAFAAATIALLAILPPWKMSASPSFMFFSMALPLVFYYIIDWSTKKAGWTDGTKSGVVEYVGRKPIRYWVLMFVLVVIPVDLYALYARVGEPLGVDWRVAAVFSLLCLPLFWLASRGIDMLPPLTRLLVGEKAA